LAKLTAAALVLKLTRSPSSFACFPSISYMMMVCLRGSSQRLVKNHNIPSTPTKSPVTILSSINSGLWDLIFRIVFLGISYMVWWCNHTMEEKSDKVTCESCPLDSIPKMIAKLFKRK
jgi:hypothetical protein